MILLTKRNVPNRDEESATVWGGPGWHHGKRAQQAEALVKGTKPEKGEEGALKAFQNRRPPERWLSAMFVGLVLCGTGLLALGLALVDCLRGWQGEPFSMITWLLELFLAVALGSVGFALMVLGSGFSDHENLGD